jgi:hypothetical protein
MWRFRGFLWALTVLLLSASALAADFVISGRVVDGQARPVAGASVLLVQGQKAHQAVTGDQGLFQLKLNSAGTYDLSVTAPMFQPLSKPVELAAGASSLDLQLIPLITRSDSVTVTADINALDVLSPDPAEKVYVRQDLLDANPGRPGAPVSIPGYPIETASSGIKAPQYFAPGVAGDHGEPIAQFIAVGTYLVPATATLIPTSLSPRSWRACRWMGAPTTFAREITRSTWQQSMDFDPALIRLSP